MNKYEKFINAGLKVSNDGTVYGKRGLPKKLMIINSGYLSTSFLHDGKPTNVLIHRMVAAAFVPNPLGLSEVNHKDGNKLNNNDWNLEWVSRSQNILHRFSSGTTMLQTQSRPATQNGRCRKVVQIKNGAIINMFDYMEGAAKAVNGTASCIRNVCAGRAFSHKGFQWEYA